MTLVATVEAADLEVTTVGDIDEIGLRFAAADLAVSSPTDAAGC